jgi:GT2 family glycosyltransferase
MASSPHLTVAIATSGRRETLSAVVLKLAAQTRLPDLLAICPAKEEDLDRSVLERVEFPTMVVEAPRAGLPTQRNALLRALKTDIVLFFDDDFVPADNYLEECAKAFEAQPDAVMCTGEVIADGGRTLGIEFDEALQLIAADHGPASVKAGVVYNCYGCNMAFRLPVAKAGGIEFDEVLPLYGWLEDVDFSRRMAPYGTIISWPNCRGVHMAVKRGRTSGVKLGYSQVMNPFYLWRKRTMSLHRAATQMGRNIAINTVRSLRPEPWIDRKGRLKGNFLAWRDIARGRIDPGRILQL